jgi:hypothetical protein
VIIYASFLIANTVIGAVAGGNDLAKSWFKLDLQCTGTGTGTGATGGTPAPGATATPSGSFRNAVSSELSALMACIKLRLPDGIEATVSSTTDSNIASGLCNPLDPNETFGDENNNCAHKRNSCHYGGQSCQSRGSFAVDYREEQNDAQIRAAAQSCSNGQAFVDNEGDHMHVSIGRINNCGCDD